MTTSTTRLTPWPKPCRPSCRPIKPRQRYDPAFGFKFYPLRVHLDPAGPGPVKVMLKQLVTDAQATHCFIRAQLTSVRLRPGPYYPQRDCVGPMPGRARAYARRRRNSLERHSMARGRAGHWSRPQRKGHFPTRRDWPGRRAAYNRLAAEPAGLRLWPARTGLPFGHRRVLLDWGFRVKGRRAG